MSDFKVIETQEQLDAIITARLERDRKTYGKQFEADLKEKGWKSPEEIEALTKDLNEQISKLQTAAADKEKIIADKDAEIAKGVALMPCSAVVPAEGLYDVKKDKIHFATPALREFGLRYWQEYRKLEQGKDKKEPQK